MAVDSAYPPHVAVIMDGNGRWAEARGLPRAAGHLQGVQAVRRLVRAALERELRWLSLYAFSAENWRRPEVEVRTLMALLESYLASEADEMASRGVRLRVLGDLAGVPERCRAAIAEAERRTRDGRRMTLQLAIGYGGRDDITSACRELVAAAAAGRLRPADVTPALIAARLATRGAPDPDLVLRTGGERRLSGFLPWQTTYAELVFSDVWWPDFTPRLLDEALAEFARRQRRYGGLAAQSPQGRPGPPACGMINETEAAR
jgi:undecaprenyl diphosphate synthase